jgi:hypothetical protein
VYNLYVPMLLPGKLNVCFSLYPDYATNIMHEHVQCNVTNLPSLSLHSSRSWPYSLMYRDTAVTSDGGSISVWPCYPSWWVSDWSCRRWMRCAVIHVGVNKLEVVKTSGWFSTLKKAMHVSERRYIPKYGLIVLRFIYWLRQNAPISYVIG